jgi:hypothetical protein
MKGGLSLGKNRIADYLTRNNYYSFTSLCLMKYESLIQRLSGNYRGTVVLYDFLSFALTRFVRSQVFWNLKNLSYLKMCIIDQ